MYVGTTKHEDTSKEDMAWTQRKDPNGRTVLEQLNLETGDLEPVPIPVLRDVYGFHSVVVYQSKNQVRLIYCPIFFSVSLSLLKRLYTCSK
jgi:hypothetical protein